MENSSYFNSVNSYQYFYPVINGDTLSQVLYKVYGMNDLRTMPEKIDKTLKLNPFIKNPDLIYPNQLIFLTPTPEKGMQTFQEQPREILAPLNKQWVELNEQEQDNFVVLSWLQNNWNFLSGLGGTTLGAGSTLLNRGNLQPLKNIATLYEQYKAGEITKNQYSYRRSLSLAKFKGQIGPFEKLLYGNKSPNEVIRISRTKAIPATKLITGHVDELAKMSKWASRGGVVLSVAGLGIACSQIASEENQHKKNEIFVESLGSFVVGGVTGVALAAVFTLTPLGWGVALVIGATGVISSYLGGQGAKYLYNAKGNGVDLVENLKIGAACS
ncbi:MAG: hypothetical protein ACI935_001780 [Moritella dasanensis]|jgi:hypothetical protein